MKTSQHSFIALSRDTFRLLPADQRTRAVQNTIALVFLAGLEVLSLAVLFPLLQLLMGVSKSQPGSLLFKTTGLSEASVNWTFVLTCVVLLYVVKNIFAVWQVRWQSRFLDNLYVKFASQIYQGFFRQSWTEYTETNSSESFRKIKNTAYEFTHNVLNGYFTVLPEVIICLLMMIVVIYIDYRILFVLALLLLPILTFYFFFRKNVVRKIDRSFRELTPQANIILSQGIDSFSEARIYAKENFFIQRFIAISKITTHQLSKLKAAVNLPTRIVETVGILCFSGIIIYGKLFPDTHQHLLIFLVMLSLVIYRIIPSINKIVTNISQIQAYAYAVSELEATLRGSKSDDRYEARGIIFNRKIEIRSVTFQYDRRSMAPILKDLSTHINKGEFVLLDGPSGSGKTTFIHLLAGLINEYEGEILIDNILLTKETRSSWQARLGFVQQAPIILQDTILHNVAFGLNSDEVERDRANEACRLAGLTEFINSLPLKINTAIGENGLTLSGGQRQRLSLARALYRDPEVLLLDEVTNQLDEDCKLLILKNLRQLSNQGKTILIISHDPLVRTIVNRTLHLLGGNILEENFSQSDAH